MDDWDRLRDHIVNKKRAWEDASRVCGRQGDPWWAKHYDGIAREDAAILAEMEKLRPTRKITQPESDAAAQE